MLVLSRKIGESIIIGDNIRITIVDVGQGRVKVGVTAPNNISIDREEIHSRKLAELPQDDAEEAIPLRIPGLHNRISGQLPDAVEQTPAPRPNVRPLSFRGKSR